MHPLQIPAQRRVRNRGPSLRPTVDCPGHADYVKNMNSPGAGAQMDRRAFWWWPPPTRPLAQTPRRHILLAKQVRRSRPGGVLNKTTMVDDEEKSLSSSNWRCASLLDSL